MAFIIVIGVLIIILIAIGSFVISIYNDLVKTRNKVKNSWAHIDAQLQRRFDLIPNLVEIIKGFTAHEKELLENVSAIRNAYMNVNTNKEKLFIDAQLNSQLKNLYEIIENYPKIKADRQFLKLQEALTEIEEDISYARQFYNDAVTIYNNKLQIFPNNIISGMFGFKEEVPFDAIKGAENAPRISFRNSHQCPSCGAVITHQGANCEYCGCSLY